MNKTAAIIGGGPAGLMAAEILSARGIKVDVYDSMPSLGRKLLMAGKSGLNLTHAEPFETFVTRYGTQGSVVRAWLEHFTPDDLRAWANELGVETFVGTSGRVFPKEMKASPLLRAWLKKLEVAGVQFHLNHRWVGFENKNPIFESPEGEKQISADAVILALGGGSWARLGSTGKWIPILESFGVEVAPLRPANCGFDIRWSEHIRTRFDGSPLKSVALSFKDFYQQGEFILTAEGVEGGLVYAASARIRDEIESSGGAVVHLDLLPDRTLPQVVEKLSKPRGSRSMSSHLEKTLNLKGVKVALLHEFVAKSDFADVEKLAMHIKSLPVPVVAPRPLDEAISSAGGVMFESLTEDLMLKNLPGVFCVGEMLDWEAPTGGYLLTACFASGRVAGYGVLKYLERMNTE